MNKVFIGGALAAIAMFIWGMLFWVVLFNSIDPTHHVADSEATGQALLEHFEADGVYFLPDSRLYDSDPETFERLHQGGPIAMVVFHPEGMPVMDPVLLVKGFLHQLLACILLGLILYKAGGSFGSYGQRFAFMALLAFSAAFYTHIGGMIWWYLPVGWALFLLFYDLVAWLIAGAILARFVKA